MNRIILLLILCFLQEPFALGLDSPYPCEAPPQIHEQIRQANANTIESLLNQYPNNFWIRRSYIELRAGYQFVQNIGIPGGKVDASVINRFKTYYENHPDDPQAAYLFAYALIHTDTPQSVKLLTDIIKKSPQFPSAYMTLAILHGYSGFLDPEKQKSYTKTFLACCPNTVEHRIASLALQLDRSDNLDAYIRSLREHIAGKEDETLLPLYNYLWLLEMKHALPGEKKQCEDRIRKDLAFLEKLDQDKFRLAQSLTIRGYGQIGDTAALKKLLAGDKPLSASTGFSAFLQARNEWSRENPMPPFTAVAEEQIKYYKKQMVFLDQWLKRIPENILVLEPRFQSLAFIPTTSNEILIHEGSLILGLARRTPVGDYTSAALRVLKAWAERDILMDQIPSITRELTSSQPPTPSSRTSTNQSDLTGSDDTTALMAENQRWTENTDSWSVLVTVYGKKGEFDQAKNILTEWTNALNERRRKADTISARQIQQLKDARTSNTSPTQLNIFNPIEISIVRGLPRDEAKYYESCAKLATAEGRTLDALTFYQSSLRLIFRGPISSADSMDLENMKTAGNAVWKQMGRKQEAWDQWMQSVQPRPAMQLQSAPRQAMKARQVPEFSLPDQHGKTWTLALFKGKTTFINVWATWCGPCRRELPEVQKLYEKTKNRNDIRVITLNIDEDRNMVEPFLKKNNFSFPSLYAHSFVKEFAGSIGIPITWISDSTATIRSETLGFMDQGGQWVEQILKQMENISRDVK
jgi:thiol-disulfide isomerase/thioredoxin